MFWADPCSEKVVLRYLVDKKDSDAETVGFCQLNVRQYIISARVCGNGCREEEPLHKILRFHISITTMILK